MSLPASRERIAEAKLALSAVTASARHEVEYPADLWRDLLATAEAYHDTADELEALRTKRLMSAVFGTPEGTACAKPFGIYAHHDGEKPGRIIGHGAEFPDGTVALRMTSDDDMYFKDVGLPSLQAVLDLEGEFQIVWYTEELEPLAAMEELIDRVLAIAEKPPVGFPPATRTRLEEAFNDGVAVMAAQVRDLILAARAVKS